MVGEGLGGCVGGVELGVVSIAVSSKVRSGVAGVLGSVMYLSRSRGTGLS